MLDLKKVAVTGGLSSGKTAVCTLFGQCNAYVVNADEIVHQLLTLQSPIGKQVLALLGRSVVKNGELDRALIAKKVFKNPLLLKKLEEYLYPTVFEIIERHYQSAKHLNSPLFIVEIPKLFEAKRESWFDVVITVTADDEISLQRYLSKGGTVDEYQKRMANQMTVKEKIARSNYIIENNGDLNQLKAAVTKLFHALNRRGVAP